MKSYDVTFMVKTNVMVDDDATEEQIAELAVEKMLKQPDEYLYIENLECVEEYLEE